MPSDDLAARSGSPPMEYVLLDTWTLLSAARRASRQSEQGQGKLFICGAGGFS